MTKDACTLLAGWLQARGVPVDSLQGGGSLDFALAKQGRRLGKAPLALTDQELAAADHLLAGWRPADWTLADAGRAYLLLSGGADGAQMQALCRTADGGALISLYRAAPLLPYDAALDWQLGEGLRSSIREVFEAIAHHSPLPQRRFDEHRWNHMVLKALFISSSLTPIVGLDARRNPALADTLFDHIAERRAAGRAVDVQVWRCVAPYLHGTRRDLLAPLQGSQAARLAQQEYDIPGSVSAADWAHLI
ncbi:EboA domain-containing protein [Ketogulonicigenium vulgare]|uniref:Uncharacterized protein n=1 Tax=Ketogulonicigenium vulgare (strain WSH-001) TaxID=759362 RepID=F9YB63_KETVW|nr:EboA domain-containing protein [Ketogulonicigenium vulgare]AEM42615.1 hypothetical protein KVU_PA0198 [Ketogulonicigenium vulgare WSH-001]ALJ82640.1 hypothetical protein KVH_15210 [Ketogulonicigenium vulgare]ANW35395.1 hypothetical protein KvSKV_15100 [Ketogulonicigenium vulgare]